MSASTVGHVQLGSAFKLPYRLLDYAGQPEYWISHQYFLTAWNSVYVIVVSLKEENEARKSFKEQLLYWLAYLASQQRRKELLGRIVVVGTYRDVATNATVAEFDAVMEELTQHVLPTLGFELAWSKV